MDNKKTLFLILLLSVLVLPTIANAQDKTLQQVVKTAADNLALLAGSLSIIAFMVAGIMFISATGSPSRLQTAKIALLAAVVGIAIVVLAKGAEYFVGQFFGLR